MVNDFEVEKYFSENTVKKSFSELSINKQSGKPLVISETQGYDYETCVLKLFKSNPLKMVDALYIKDNQLYFIEFKSGFVQNINYDTFDITKWWCNSAEKTCEEGAKIFLKNQELIIDELIESVKGKLLETNAILFKLILPKCEVSKKSYKIHYVAVVDELQNPIESIENVFGSLGNSIKKESPINRLRDSLKKYNINDAFGNPMFFDYIDVWNTFDFIERTKA